MFSSFFQLMGFPALKPVNSPAKQVAQGQPSKAGAEGISLNASGGATNTRQTSTSDVIEQKKSARRQDVKSQTVKAKETPKATHAGVKVKPGIKAAGEASARCEISARCRGQTAGQQEGTGQAVSAGESGGERAQVGSRNRG
jgi:hypothetical protein